MSVEEANDELRDELLSAYIDDELTAEERALVEERLRTDARAARLVSEMRSLSSTLKSLPRETLGRDLATVVPAEAQRAQVSLASHGRGDAAGGPPGDYDSRTGLPRRLIWAVLAIAATLMLSVLLPQDPPREARDVAAARQDRRAEGPPPPGVMRAGGDEKMKVDVLESKGSIARSASGVNDPASPAPSSGDVLAPAIPAPPEAIRDHALGMRYQEGSAEEASAPPEGEALESFAAQGLPAPAAAPPAAEPAEAAPATAAATEIPVDAKERAAAPQVVLTTNSADSVEQFYRLLSDNGIVLDERPAEAAPARGMEGLAGEEQQGTTLAESSPARPSDKDRGDPLQAVVVEAPPGTIEQLIAACATDKTAFALVEVRAAAESAEEGAESSMTRSAARAAADPSQIVAGGAATGGAYGGLGRYQRAADAIADLSPPPSDDFSGPTVAVDEPLITLDAPGEAGRAAAKPAVGRAWKLALADKESGQKKLEALARLRRAEWAAEGEPRDRVLFLFQQGVAPAMEAAEPK